MIIKLKEMIMNRYCPEFWEKMPLPDNYNYNVDVVIIYGYWSANYKVVKTKNITGSIDAYLWVRWEALKSQWVRPNFFNGNGIAYGMKRIDL